MCTLAGPAAPAQLAPTATSLATSALQVNPRDQVTLTAHVAGSGSPNPTGVVTFRESVTLTSMDVPLTASGDATWTTTPAVDHGSYTATYNGDTNFSPSTSATVIVQVPPAYPLVSAAPTALTIATSDPSIAVATLSGAVTLTNPGRAPLVVNSASVSFLAYMPGTFQVSGPCVNGAPIPPGGACAVTLQGSIGPTGLFGGTAYSASLTIAHNAAGSPLVIPINLAFPNAPVTSTITAWSPPAVPSGNPLTLLIGGTGFSTATKIQWNGSAHDVVLISPTQVQVPLSYGDTPPLSAYSLSLQSSGRSFSVPGVPPFPKSLGSGSYTYYVPHIVAGNGFITTMSLVNLANKSNGVAINYISQTGALLESDNYMLDPGGSLRLGPPAGGGPGGARTDWAEIDSTDKLSVNVFFENLDANGNVLSTVGFGASTLMRRFIFPIDHENASATTSARTIGLAMANPSSTAATATVTLLDANGAVLGTTSISIPACGQTAIDLDQLTDLHNAFPPGRFMGEIRVTTTSPVAAVVVGDDQGPFYAIRPVALP